VTTPDCERAQEEINALRIECLKVQTAMLDRVRRDFVSKDEHNRTQSDLKEVTAVVRKLEKTVYAAVILFTAAMFLGRIAARYMFA
jgi:hypothetical protein